MNSLSNGFDSVSGVCSRHSTAHGKLRLRGYGTSNPFNLGKCQNPYRELSEVQLTNYCINYLVQLITSPCLVGATNKWKYVLNQ